MASSSMVRVKPIFSLGLFPCFSCILDIIKQPKMMRSALSCNPCSPFAVEFAPINTNYTGSVVSRLAAILRVYPRRYGSKVAIGVVVAYMINMIDLFRKTAIHVEPSKSVSKIVFPIKTYGYISSVMFSASDFACHRLATGVSNPGKKACFWVIIENLFKTILRYTGFNHVASPKRHMIGSRVLSYPVADFNIAGVNGNEF